MTDKKISVLNAADPLTGSETFPIVQSSTTRKATLDDLPIGTATQNALDEKSNVQDPSFSGSLTIAGDIIPDENVSRDIGSSSLRFRDIYLSGSTIDLGGTILSSNNNGDLELRDDNNNLKDVVAKSLQVGTTKDKILVTRDSNGQISFDNFDSDTGNTGPSVAIKLTENSTDDLEEGTSNLYYTDTRARNAVSASGDLSYDPATGVFSFTETPNYTDADVDAHLTGGTGVIVSQGEISIDQSIGTNDDLTFRNLTLSGNLSVNGTTTTINTETLEIADNLIFNSDFSGSSPSQNAGIEVNRGTSDTAIIQWNETDDEWELGIGSTTSRILTESDEGNLDAGTLDSQPGSFYLDYENFTNKPAESSTATSFAMTLLFA